MSDPKQRSRRDSEGPAEGGGPKAGFTVGGSKRDSEGPGEKKGPKAGFTVGGSGKSDPEDEDAGSTEDG